MAGSRTVVFCSYRRNITCSVCKSKSEGSLKWKWSEVRRETQALGKRELLQTYALPPSGHTVISTHFLHHTVRNLPRMLVLGDCHRTLPWMYLYCGTQ